MKGVIQHIVTKESIQEVSVLRDLLVRMPVVNPTLEVIRCVLAFQVHARQRKVKCTDFVPVAFLCGFRSWYRR